MALPFKNTQGPPATAATSEPLVEQPRHLHAVTVSESAAEITAEFPPVAAGRGNGVRGQASGAMSVVRAVFIPDSGLWHDRQPSIAETARRARRGGHVAERGPLRVISTVHGYLAVANKAVCQTWLWIVEHPARLVTVLAVLGLAIAFPPTRHLLAWLLTPIVWVQHALD